MSFGVLMWAPAVDSLRVARRHDQELAAIERDRLRERVTILTTELSDLRSLHMRQNEKVIVFDRGRLHEMASHAAVERIAMLERDVAWLRENNQLLAQSAEHFRSRFEAGK